MKTSKQSENEKNIKEIFKSNNWGIELLEYVKKHGNEYLDRRQFLNEFCISEIVGKIAESNSKNIGIGITKKEAMEYLSQILKEIKEILE